MPFIWSAILYGVLTGLGKGAFYYCDSLTRVTIGDGVTSIGVGVFSGCSSLESIVLEEGNIVYYSEGNCVIRTDSKTLVVGCKNSVIPSNGSVTSIGEDAFYGCSSLASITIPDSVTSIGYKAFYHCDSLTSIVIPDSVTSIGEYAFAYCDSLTSITIGDSVTSIGVVAFERCGALTSINFQGSMKQWKAIYKGTEWNSGTGSYKVICTDGVLDKYDNQI